jgi:hypothetical protein
MCLTASFKLGSHQLFAGAAVSVLLVATGASFALPEDTPTSQNSESEADEEARQEIVRIAKAYELFTEPNRQPLVMQAEPALRWPNPTRETRDGATFIWTLDGRPAAIACIWKQRFHSFAFQSLSDGPITAEHSGSTIWLAENSGVTFHPLSGVSEPAESPAKRLIQMRDLARRFHCRVASEQSKKEELRLLPKPLYRYAPSGDELLDGALFAFVQGTDPEVVLSLEARRADGKATWSYAFTRRSMMALEADLDEEAVWSVPLSIGSARDPWFHGDVR